MTDEQTFDPQNGKQQPLLDHDKIDISDDTQQRLNEPIQHPSGLDDKDQALLALIMEKIDKGEIDLYRPSTLLNQPVYERLDETAQGKADFDAVNLLTSIREISKLWQSGHQNTYQIENLVHRIRITKERLEEIGGDIFVI